MTCKTCSMSLCRTPRGLRAAAFASLFGAALWVGPVIAQAPAAAPETEKAAPAIAQPSAAGVPAPAASPEAAPATESAPAASAEPAQGEPASAAHITQSLLPSALPRDLSPWGMFLSAMPIVQAVMVALAFASLATWTIWLAKAIELWNARKLARRGLEVLVSTTSLPAAAKKLASAPSPVARFAAAAAGEANQSKGLAPEGIKDRATALLSRIESQAGRKISRGTGILATIGATAVFVGLFGTVWGIMDSFIGISKTNTTNLAVVAPGIAEALQATAMGLVAAIPAVVMYNAFARSITGYRALLADAAAEVLRHLSRDLDRDARARQEGDAAVIPLRQSAE
jgi:biopolymer transport protein ExbB